MFVWLSRGTSQSHHLGIPEKTEMGLIYILESAGVAGGCRREFALLGALFAESGVVLDSKVP